MVRSYKAVAMAMAALVLVMAAATASGDRVYLADGGILTGTVTQVADGSLTLATDYAGELTVDMSKVVGVTTDQPMATKLATGDSLVGRLVYDPAGKQQQVGEGGAAPATADVASIAGLWEPGTDSPEMAAMKAAATKRDGAWSGRVELGINGQTGNSERTNVNGLIEAKLTTQRERLTIYAFERFGKEDGVRSVNETIGGADLEVDFAERWFAFGGLELEYDEFEDLDLRTTAAAGVGYFLIRDDDEKLKVRGGGGYLHESYSDGTRNSDAIVELGVHYSKRFSEWLSFTHDTTYYPTLSDLGDYRIVMENAGEVALNNNKTLGLRAGVRHAYDSRPLAEIERMDVFYFLNMVMKFE